MQQVIEQTNKVILYAKKFIVNICNRDSDFDKEEFEYYLCDISYFLDKLFAATFADIFNKKVNMKTKKNLVKP